MLHAMPSLPFWEGHIVDSVQEQEDGSLLIVLETCPASDALCGVCRQPCALVHERRRRKAYSALSWTSSPCTKGIGMPLSPWMLSECGCCGLEKETAGKQSGHSSRCWERKVAGVAMDINTAMDLEVRQQCPNAEVVYDLFHVVARSGREVVDRVRVDQANTLRAEPKARQVIKRSRWLLLRNRANLKAEQAVKLEELLAANQPLSTVYLLKTEL